MKQLEGHSYHLVTFGCQMNKYDSEKIDGILTSAGMSPTGDPSKADLILLNTCSIREKAENKVFSMLGRLDRQKRPNGKAAIALGGCMATLRKEGLFKRAPMVDILFGPDSIAELPSLIQDFFATGGKQSHLSFNDSSIWDRPESNVRPSSVTAWVGIMKGCNNHCTYCVVPSTRGPEVSRSPSSIVKEIEELAQKGYREVYLLGQNVNSYCGGDEAGSKIDFPKLLRLVEGVEGIWRIRFMTSHPKDLSDELIDAMASSKKICPSLHLPLQSGSDRILEMMNRRYRAAEYMEKVKKLKAAVPGITVSSDLMFGFPSETEYDFKQSLDLMEEVQFDSLYLFNYSHRPGTPAADYPDYAGLNESKSRFKRALKLHKRIIAQKNEKLVGKTFTVLCEGPYRKIYSGKKGTAPLNRWFGRTPGNHLVLFSSDRDVSGQILQLTITSFLGYNLEGKIS